MSGANAALHQRTRPISTRGDLCLEFHPNGVLHQYNIDSRSNILGVKPSSVLGILPDDLPIDAEHRARINDAFEEVSRTRSATTLRLPLPHLDEAFVLQADVHPLQASPESSCGFLVLNRVIPVLASDQMTDWQGLFGQTSDIVIVLDANGHVAYSNAGKGHVFPTIQVGSTLERHFERDGDSLQISLDRALAQDHSTSFEYTREDGRVTRWFTCTVSPLYVNGKRHVTAILRETSWLKSQLMALQQENSFYHHLLDGRAEAVIAVDKTGSIDFMNPAARELPGLPVANWFEAANTGKIRLFTGRSHRELKPSDWPVQRVLEGASPEPLEVEWAAAGAEPIPLLFATHPTKDNHGNCNGALAVLHPLSPTRLEEQHKLWTFQAMSQLVQTVSHDFRMPVNNLVHLCKLARLQGNAEQQRDNIQQRIEHTALQIQQQLDGLMTLVRTGGDMPRTIDRCAFQNVWEDVKQSLSQTIESAKAEVRVNFDACPTVAFHRSQLHSIVFNLVSNAIKYRSLERKPVVHLSSGTSGGEIVFTVRDNGRGIDLEKDDQNLWAPFRRLRENDAGKGLGLALVRQMVDQAGGRIEVESTLGRGTSFHVFFASSNKPSEQYRLF